MTFIRTFYSQLIFILCFSTATINAQTQNFEINCDLDIVLKDNTAIKKQYKKKYDGSKSDIITDQIKINNFRDQKVYVNFYSDYASIGIYDKDETVYADTEITPKNNTLIAYSKSAYDPDIVKRMLQCRFKKLQQ